MTSRDNVSPEITPEVLLRAYACGIFPMAESADDPTLFWVEPEQRGVIPLDGFHVSSRLARTVRSDRFTVTVNRAFDDVIARLRGAAAGPRGHLDQPPHPQSLQRPASARPLPQRRGLGRRAAGRRPLRRRLGGAFFGESMFHRERDASKVALVHLVARLIAGGFVLLDTQFVTDHLRSFGATEVPRRRYRTELDEAVAGDADVSVLSGARVMSGAEALALIEKA